MPQASVGATDLPVAPLLPRGKEETQGKEAVRAARRRHPASAVWGDRGASA